MYRAAKRKRATFFAERRPLSFHEPPDGQIIEEALSVAFSGNPPGV
jgi:hypothetical protein